MLLPGGSLGLRLGSILKQLDLHRQPLLCFPARWPPPNLLRLSLARWNLPPPCCRHLTTPLREENGVTSLTEEWPR